MLKVEYMSEFTIELRGLEFFSFHGLYEEEKKVGGEFVVDVIAKFPAQDHKLTSIDETVNYAALFAIVNEEMTQPRELLETVAQAIADKIYAKYTVIKEIEIRIEKKKAPIVGITGTVAAGYRKVY
ncbi:MAG TPA: dihydroneopterin aldolase [Chitinophagaceae bacterium]|jgi:dihydroneopterin aldolase|nr:dihydroneopterin aldolase [Chitinophagaceae bacterium]